LVVVLGSGVGERVGEVLWSMKLCVVVDGKAMNGDDF
jgi:hypothetical protein